ncbi:unnamed protein product [Dovyalis caffra]|uniref:Uncharacterized protein n=1 Tax=Dovyalis caffra TaxID=77055 RepID=A0AAV1SF51_9ROSI|nr:unnamed protein product [Dovyalis caffra]
MKITKFLVLSFFLFAFTASSFPEAIQAKDPEPVVDIFGNELEAGRSYFIRAFPAGSATTLAVSSEGTCPPDVRLSTIFNKVSVRITPIQNDSVIYEDTYVNFNLEVPTCRRGDVTTMWKVSYKPGMDRYIVTTGGMGPLKQFKITKDRANDGLYQLSYYPTSEAFNKRLRFELGYLADNDDVTYLTPNANPVLFAFVPYLVEVPKIEYKKVSE